jgi:hypothetical protein
MQHAVFIKQKASISMRSQRIYFSGGHGPLGLVLEEKSLSRFTSPLSL